MMGATPEQAARELTEAGADAVGANCGSGIAAYVPVCRRLLRHFAGVRAGAGGGLSGVSFGVRKRCSHSAAGLHPNGELKLAGGRSPMPQPGSPLE